MNRMSYGVRVGRRTALLTQEGKLARLRHHRAPPILRSIDLANTNLLYARPCGRSARRLVLNSKVRKYRNVAL